MIQEFVDRFMSNRDIIRKIFEKDHPGNYRDIVENVVLVISGDGYSDYNLDSERITEIDDGSYQGTLLYVISEKGYQPNIYYYVKINYGSCSGCDTLQAIRRYSDKKPSEDQIKEYMDLALHIVQGIKRMD